MNLRITRTFQYFLVQAMVYLLILNYISLQNFTLFYILAINESIIEFMSDVKRISSINSFLNFVTEVIP
jgi:hypothetical protein